MIDLASDARQVAVLVGVERTTEPLGEKLHVRRDHLEGTAEVVARRDEVGESLLGLAHAEVSLRRSRQ
jgi:hypothetical protein